MPFRVKRQAPLPYPMAKSPGFLTGQGRLTLQQMAIRLGFLQWQSAQEDTGDILDNLAYVSGVGPERFTNPGVVGGVGSIYTFTGDDPDGKTIGGEAGNDPEISEVNTGEGHAESPNAGGGHINYYSSSVGIVESEAVTDIGDTYESVVDVDNVVAGAVMRSTASFHNIFPSISSAGITTVRFIAPHSTFGIKRHAFPTDVTIAGHSVKKTGELDCQLAGTPTPGVAGYRGQKAGALGAEEVGDPEMDDLGWWSEDNEGAGRTITFASSQITMNSDGSAYLQFSRNSLLTKGQTYQFTIKIDTLSTSGVGLRIVDSSTSVPLTKLETGTFAQYNNGETGTFTFTFVAPSSNPAILLNAGYSSTAVIDSINIKPFSTPHAAYLDGATSKAYSRNAAADGLTDFTVVLQFYGFALTSKYLADKDAEFRIEVSASDKLVVTRNRATTDDTFTSTTTITENAWHRVIVRFSDGDIEAWIDGVKDASSASAGSGAVVSNTNAIYWGGDNAASFVIDGVLDEFGLDDSALSDNNIGIVDAQLVA